MSEECDVILVFVNENEKKAVCDVFKEKCEHDPGVKGGDVLTYHNFGSIGGAKVLGLQIEMGSTTRGGSSAALPEAIKETSPQYVILVGIAFGMDRKKQRIGDILVSNKLALYEMRRIGTNKKGEDVEIKRGDTAAASERILGKFKAWSSSNHWQGSPVHFGLMLSGEKLIDNPKFKEKLQNEYPDAIGGEMEAAGAYVAAEFYKRDWIVVKAVCDYADGTKKHNKQKKQELAAKNAAQLVFHVLEQGNFGNGFSVSRISSEKEKKEEKETTSARIEIKKLVIENITIILNKKKMDCIRLALNHRLNQEKKEKEQYKIDQMAAMLADMSVLDAVITLDLAVKDCIEAIKDADGSVDLINSIWHDSVSILGWIVLLGVDDEWVDSASRCLANKGEHLELVIPVETPAGPEIAYSRLKETQAHLRIHKPTKDVFGEQGIPCDDWNIEDGWHTPDKVTTIKKILWKQLIKADPGSGEFSKNMDAELNQTLFTRRKKGEHHYIAINRSCKNNPLLEEDVYKALIHDLPDLEIFSFGSGDQGVAIIGEHLLHAQLREFFRNQPA